MADSAVNAFRGKRYLNLESFRRDGSGVRTPLWFVEAEGALFVRTPGNFAKVKRIQRNPRVRVAPSNMRGTPTGEWMEGTARIVDDAEAERINQLLKRKYSWQRALIDFGSWLRGRKSVVIEIRI